MLIFHQSFYLQEARKVFLVLMPKIVYRYAQRYHHCSFISLYRLVTCSVTCIDDLRITVGKVETAFDQLGSHQDVIAHINIERQRREPFKRHTRVGQLFYTNIVIVSKPVK